MKTEMRKLTSRKPLHAAAGAFIALAASILPSAASANRR